MTTTTSAYTVVFQNAITRRSGGSVQHDCDTFEAAVTLANDVSERPFNNTRVCLINFDSGHVDRICPDRQHRFDFDSTGEILCVCGFRPKGVGADAEEQVEEHTRQHGITG